MVFATSGDHASHFFAASRDTFGNWSRACALGGELSVPSQTMSVPERKDLFSRFWRSASGFWRNSLSIWALVALIVVAVLLGLLVQYRLNIWNRDFFDALERKDGPELWRQALVFAPLIAASTTLAIFGVWSRMTAQRKWREWLSRHL
ncbi:MAG: hypothetical protein ACXW3S_10330, partial [Rhodoplanes sp.]